MDDEEGGNSLRHLVAHMSPYINENGLQVVESQELIDDPTKFTEKLLDLKRRIDDMVDKGFNNEMKMQKCRD